MKTKRTKGITMMRWFLLWLLSLVAIVVAGFLNYVLTDLKAYRNFVEAASPLGVRIIVVAALVLVADIAAMIVYTIRQGKSDNLKGTVVTENRPMTAMSFGTPPMMGRSKRKILGSKSEFVSMESLLDGSATLGERIMVLGIITVFISFFSIFLGVGLMLMKNLVLSVLFPVVPGILVYSFARDVWRDYKKAKSRVAARGERVDAPQPIPSGR
jgi:hypothetical protein